MTQISLLEKGKTSIDICPVCGSKNTKEKYDANIKAEAIDFSYKKNLASRNTLRVVRCRRCTHMFCSPIPNNIYKNYKEVKDEIYLDQELSRKRSAKIAMSIVERYKPVGRLLDVGCATGEFLEVARSSGYDVEGLELSKWSSEIARKKGLEVHRTDLYALSKKKHDRYDVITMWGVIEHFQHPKKEMQHLKTLLKKDGILVVWTGDVNSITSLLLGKRWWYWQGQHVQYFSHSSLNHLAKLYGINPIAKHTYPNTAMYENINNSLKIYKLHKLLMAPLKVIFKIKPVWTLYLPGEMLWIGQKSSGK